MIAALLIARPDLIKTAMLLHPLLPFSDAKNMSSSVFISRGERDTMITPAQTAELVSYLKGCGATLTEFVHKGGHEITADEVAAARVFIAKHKVAE